MMWMRRWLTGLCLAGTVAAGSGFGPPVYGAFGLHELQKINAEADVQFPPELEDYAGSLEGAFSDEEKEQMGKWMEEEENGEGGKNPWSEMGLSAQKVENPELSVTYDAKNHWFTYRLSNGAEFSADVPNGLLTCDPVTVLPVSNAYTTLSRNGSKEEIAEDGYYAEPGNYHMRMLCYNQSLGAKDFNIYQIDFFFRILPPVTSEVNLVNAPDGFYIEKVERSGVEWEPENPRWEFLKEDGRYQIWLKDEKTGQIRLRQSFVRDTTGPFLTFTPPIDKAVMDDLVTLSLNEPEVGLEVYYNGEPATLVSNQVEEGGYYQFRVSDRAGNQRIYELRMASRLHLFDYRVGIVILISVFALIVCLIYQRTHMKVL